MTYHEDVDSVKDSFKKMLEKGSIDEWEKFYIEQSLKCYNADAFEAALIILGLAGEYLTTKLIEKVDAFLLKNETSLQATYQTALQNKRVISQRYAEYENILKEVLKQKDSSNQCKYLDLKALSPLLDGAAKAVYATYLRLTRRNHRKQRRRMAYRPYTQLFLVVPLPLTDSH